MSEFAIQRDGAKLFIGDEVIVKPGLNKKCEGLLFVICQINPYPDCESGSKVVVHLKGSPDRKLLGFKKEGHDLGPDGIDANWARLHQLLLPCLQAKILIGRQ